MLVLSLLPIIVNHCFFPTFLLFKVINPYTPEFSPPKRVFLNVKLNFWCYDLEFT